MSLPLGVLAAACSEDTDEVFFVADADPIDGVQVIAKDATVELTGGRLDEEIRVTATRTYSAHRPAVNVERIEGRLHVSHRCRRQRVCEVHYRITMPSDTDATVLADGGSVLATGLWGDLDLSTVWGDVFAAGLRSSDVSVTTDIGDVTLSFEAPPDRVGVETVEGNVSVSVPTGEDYRLELDSNRGDISVSDLSSEDDAERSIVIVSSGGGDVDVRGTEPVTDRDETDETDDED